MANNLVTLLKKHALTIAVAESYTGGAFSAYITSFPGASKVFKGSIVAYSREMKEQLLHIDKNLIDQFGMVSKECGLAMAHQCKALFNVDIALSFTGNAGPSSSENKPVGEVYITLLSKDIVRQVCLHLQGSRKQIQKQSITYAVAEIFGIIDKVD